MQKTPDRNLVCSISNELWNNNRIGSESWRKQNILVIFILLPQAPGFWQDSTSVKPKTYSPETIHWVLPQDWKGDKQKIIWHLGEFFFLIFLYVQTSAYISLCWSALCHNWDPTLQVTPNECFNWFQLYSEMRLRICKFYKSLWKEIWFFPIWCVHTM